LDVGSEDHVPELAAHSEPDCSELVVVLHVVQLHVPQPAFVRVKVVHRVVNHFVGLVTEQYPDEEVVKVFLGHARLKGGEDQGIEQEQLAGEWGKHDALSVLGESVVDAVDGEVGGEYPAVMRHVRHPVVLAVEQVPVDNILCQCPRECSKEGNKKHRKGVERKVDLGHPVDAIKVPGEVGHDDVPPLGATDCFQEPVVEEDDVADRVDQVLRLVDKRHVFFKSKFSVENLNE